MNRSCRQLTPKLNRCCVASDGKFEPKLSKTQPQVILGQSTIDDEFQQISIWVTEVNAVSDFAALRPRSCPLYWSELDLNTLRRNEFNCFFARAVPHKTKVTTTG